MGNNIDNIINIVCDVCDVKREEVMCNSRQIPLPLFRGFIWYAIRKVTGYSNAYIAKITADENCHYTGGAVGIAINRIMDAMQRDRYWKTCWKEVADRLDLPSNIKNGDNAITIIAVVPKGQKDNVKIEIKERTR